MTVGLPGVGLGGIFYLLTAGLMPVRELVRAVRGERPARWRIVRKQTSIAAGILGALWLTGWMLGTLIAASRAALAATGGATTLSHGAHNVLRVSALVVSLSTLLVVLASVQVARLFVRRVVARGIGGIRSIDDTGRMSEGPGTGTPHAPRSGRVDSGTFGRAQ